MKQRWGRVGEYASRSALPTLAAVGAITVLLGFGVARLDFATGQESYLDADDPASIANRTYQDVFGGEAMVALFTMEDGGVIEDLFTSANLERFEDIRDELSASSDTFAVLSPATPLQWTQQLVLGGAGAEILARGAEREPDPAGRAARTQDGEITAARVAAAGTPSLESREWVRFLVYSNEGFELRDGSLVAPAEEDLVIRSGLRSTFPDRQHALFVTFLTGNASLDQLTAGGDLVRGAFADVDFDGADVVVAGTPTFLSDINGYLQGGMATLGAIAAVAMLVVLGLAFRVRWRILPLAVVLVGMVWAFGAFGLLGFDLSLVTIAGLPILIGVGIDFAIQVHNRTEEECVARRADSPIGESLSRLGPPMATATVAAVLAFLSMRLSLVPMIRDFGLLLAIGMVAVLVVGAVVPAAALGLRERRRPTTELSPSRIGSAVRRLGSAPPRVFVPLLAAAVVLPVVGVTLERNAPIESDPINWADQDSSSVRNARTLEEETGFATTLGLFIETTGVPENGVFTDELAEFTFDAARAALEANPELASASSLVTSVAGLLAVPGATALPPTGLDLLQAHAAAPPDVQRLLVSADGNDQQVTFWVGASSLEDRSDVVDRVEAVVDHPASGDAPIPANATATAAGLARVGVGLLDNLTANRAALTVIALLLVAAWVAIRFGSLVRAALSLVPVLVAVGAASTLVSVMGITLSPLTTVSGPLVIATCAEFSVLILGRYLEERERGLTATEASAVASERTGRAFVASGLTTIGGFGVLVFASLPLLRDFGAVVTVNVAVALLAALVIVPPAALWADERGLLVGDPGPGRGRTTAWAVGAALAVLALGAGAVVLDEDDERLRTPTTVAAATSVATLPPSTSPTTGGSTADGTLPPGPAERPPGLVAGGIYDRLVEAGTDPGVARCTTDTLLSEVSEGDLLVMGIASGAPEALALVATAAERCGVPADIVAQVGGG